MPPPNLVRSTKRIEELPTDDGSVLDTIAGAILRIFVRINELEAANARLVRRLKALEAPGVSTHPEARGNGQQGILHRHMAADALRAGAAGLVVMVLRLVEFSRHVALRTESIALGAQLGAMRVVTVGAGDPGGMHAALHERAVFVDLAVDPPVGVIETCTKVGMDRGQQPRRSWSAPKWTVAILTLMRNQSPPTTRHGISKRNVAPARTISRPLFERFKTGQITRLQKPDRSTSQLQFSRSAIAPRRGAMLNSRRRQ
jgi:hypothetical protein